MTAELSIAAGIGLLSGLHTAIWGMYKDAIHEGFGRVRFWRSVAVGAIAAIVLQRIFRLALPAPAALVVLFGLAYAAERGVVEIWKTFVRQEDQSKYFIPMQFSIGGQPVRNHFVRLGVGLGYLGLIVAGLYFTRLPGFPRWLSAAIGGLAVGVVVAIGGGWKDAPKEGFDLLKFFRSPAMTTAYAVLLSFITDNHLHMVAAAIGYERATVETYKTFFFPTRPRGKFQGMPILHPEMLTRRRYFVPAYAAITVAILGCIVAAL
jgi:hypothetical protein